MRVLSHHQRSERKHELSLFEHIRRTKAMMERRHKIRSTSTCCEYETDGSMKFITGEDLEL